MYNITYFWHNIMHKPWPCHCSGLECALGYNHFTFVSSLEIQPLWIFEKYFIAHSEASVDLISFFRRIMVRIVITPDGNVVGENGAVNFMFLYVDIYHRSSTFSISLNFHLFLNVTFIAEVCP